MRFSPLSFFLGTETRLLTIKHTYVCMYIQRMMQKPASEPKYLRHIHHYCNKRKSTMHVKGRMRRRILKEEVKLGALKRYVFHHVLKLLEIYPTIPIPIYRKYHLSHPINLPPFRQS